MGDDGGETHGLDTVPGRLVTTDILINAPPERVRAVFMDFAAWPEWSAFLKSFQSPSTASPELKAGDTVEVVLGGMGTIRPTIVANTDSRFAWLGVLGVRGIFDGQHEFHFLPAAGSGAAGAGQTTTHFVHREIFNGLLITPLLGWAGMHAGIQANFEQFNASLKARVEGLQP